MVLLKRIGPKRMTKVGKLSKEDNIRTYAVRREKENAKPYTKASVNRRKLEHQKEQKAEYDALFGRVAKKKVKVAAVKASYHQNFFRLILIESRIHRLACYYKTEQQIHSTFEYDYATASILIS
ncbi:40S ribosomal protein S6 [Marasmius crinis-equi]|uniref:40S ribosomal protein S6 n=1 Tax=Marasmius crinis-equi TaxID=585013 RepID=A0ABR3F9B4_9AGAR